MAAGGCKMQKTMFMPNFKYTNQIVNRLSKIAVAREVILNSPLVPKWQVSLRKEAIIRSAHSSTSIEGNRLNISQAALKEIGKLLELEVVRLVGQKRGARYILT
jgi:Fic family protein